MPRYGAFARSLPRLATSTLRRTAVCPFAWQMGAGQLEQWSKSMAWSLSSVPRSCRPLTLAILGATHDAAATQVTITVRTGLGVVVRGPRVTPSPTSGWSTVHAACFLGFCFWRKEVTAVSEDLLLEVAGTAAAQYLGAC